MHPSRNYLESMISWGEKETSTEKIIKPEECFALRRGSIYKMDEPKRGLACAHQFAKSNRPYLCVPLYAQSDIIGLLYLEWEQGEFNLSANQELLIAMLAEQIALGISNIKLRETLRIQSFRDPLTGLYNRRYLEETFERELSRCKRKSASLVIFMVDIDHFKEFNDQFGHDAGDLVIQSIGDLLRNFARKDDIPCRYGGEEFVFVLSDIEFEATKKRVQDLHDAVHQLHIKYADKTLPKITISVGVSTFPTDGELMNDLISAADAALYKAKKTGRNKTVFYEKDL